MIALGVTYFPKDKHEISIEEYSVHINNKEKKPTKIDENADNVLCQIYGK